MDFANFAQNSSSNSQQNVKNSQANFLTNLKQIFALPKWARIFLAILSVIALFGLGFGGALQIYAKDKNFSANLTFERQNSHEILPSGEFSYRIRAHFESLDFLLRSKTIAKIKIAQISWDESRINPSQILSYEAQNRYLALNSTQPPEFFDALKGENLGVLTYKIDFSPFFGTILKYYAWFVILTLVFFSKFLPFLVNLIKTQSLKARICLVCVAFCLMSVSFYSNAFKISSQGWFENFLKDCESHIPATILALRQGYDTQGFGLSSIAPQINYPNPYSAQSHEMLAKNIKVEKFGHYTSTIGLQGYMWAFLYEKFGDFKPLRVICALLSAFCIVLVSVLLGRIFGSLFGIIFWLSMFLSPWVTNYATHLYFTLWGFFLPSIFSFLIYLNLANLKPHKLPLTLLILGFALSLAFRYTNSYEFTTSVILFALAPFLVAFLFGFKGANLSEAKPLNFKALNAKTAFKWAFGLFILSVFIFAVIFCYHAYLRGGENLWLGLVEIYEKDFLRRMVGGAAANFHQAYADSLNANVLAVVWKYFSWHTPIIVGLELQKAFIVWFILDILLIIFAFKGAARRLLISMFIAFLLVPLSWFILGKAHSFIHTHLNFIVWYLGFIAILLFVPILAVFERGKALVKMAKFS